MSVAAAKAFVKKLKADQELDEKVTACANATELLKVIADAGFDCTSDELKECTDLLADSDLDKVVGGGIWDCTSPQYKQIIRDACLAGRPNSPQDLRRPPQ